MERLALIGVSHRRGGAAALEAWQRTYPADTGDALRALGFREWVALQTCNRWDLVVSLPPGMGIDEARRRLTPAGITAKPYAYLADGALEQLARVASSLDSLNPGEDQIMAQVREAFNRARERETVGPDTSFAFHTALRIAKRVRREVALAPMNTSLFSLARPALERMLPHGALVAVLGAGQMGTLAAKTVRGLGYHVLVANRSAERAETLARHLDGEAWSLEAFLASPPRVDALVCALGAGDVVTESLLETSAPRLVIDLGIPRNVRPGAARGLGIELLDVDSLQAAGAERREEIALRLAEAEALVADELEAALTEWTERQLGPAITRIRELYLATIGDALPPEDAQRLAHRFAHIPVKGLRAVAREHGIDAARTFLAETGLIE